MSSLLDLLKAKKQSIDASNRKKTAKPPLNTSRWRILPSWRGEGQQFWHDFGQHFVKDASGKMMAIYMCSDKTYGRPCAVCDAIHTGIKSSSDDFTAKLLKDAGSSGRILVNALQLDGPTPTEVQILELAPSAFNAIISIAQEWEEAGESIFDPVKGKDILITRTGAGLLTKYTVQVAAKALPLPDGVLTRLNDLDTYVAQESSEQQLRALNSVRSVAGLLEGPAVRTGLPAAAAALGAATLVEEDPYAVAAPPPKRVAPVAVVEDVIVKAPVAVKAAVVAAKAPVAAAPADDTGDAELDAMLAALGS